MKMLKLERFGTHAIILHVDNYANNGNLAVQMLKVTESFYEPWSTLTVNLGKKCEPDCAFIDVNNNGDEIVDWLIENKLGVFTNEIEISGFCIYPKFKFDMDVVHQYTMGPF